MHRSLNVLVVGAGLMGLSTARSLLRLGHNVTVVDASPIPNPDGASVDHHRLIRVTYGGSRGYTRMAIEAYQAWDRFWNEIGVTHYVQTGTLIVGDLSDPWVRATEESLESESIAFEKIESGLGDRYPVLDPSLDKGLFVAQGGVLLARRIVQSLHDFVVRQGAEMVLGGRVKSVGVGAASVRLHDGRQLTGDRLVLAAGAWLPDLLVLPHAPITPSRQVCVLLESPASLRGQWTQMPMLINLDEADGFYAVPPVTGTPLKVGDHRFSMKGHPDDPRGVAGHEVDAILARLHGRLSTPDAYSCISSTACYYSVAEGERFVVEERDRTWVLTGFSGHGFKFGPLIGERVAEAIDGTRSGRDVSRWAAGELGF